ncbi:hypothetical protein BO70DRAFT_188025 [Aspergillus heteromorphus CBS 117.55]|uniref:Uncharacterized protein n=1 Tax=Aspergillus heteromorphus CBS 117.55 TaxID=1448321 RepID=A0A317UXV4_9EURO|nr:uncharacterized protein BO70DRAFT_188025 [Aspergillus heteromorphus CBS 117.55]PWY65347.1 hypothetical protein BO70DRAFT_188025 [Aspergillus heteromorphus CBS 117.55]
MLRTRPVTVPRRAPLPVITVAVRDTSPPRRSPATAVVLPVISLVNARQARPRATVPLLAVRNATSAVGLATSRETAPKVAAMEVDLVAVNRHATLAAASAIWLATAPTARSATTVEKLDMSPATALPKPRVNGCATTASNLGMSKPRALTNHSILLLHRLSSVALAHAGLKYGIVFDRALRADPQCVAPVFA